MRIIPRTISSVVVARVFMLAASSCLLGSGLAAQAPATGESGVTETGTGEAEGGEAEA